MTGQNGRLETFRQAFGTELSIYLIKVMSDFDDLLADGLSYEEAIEEVIRWRMDDIREAEDVGLESVTEARSWRELV